MGKKLAFLFLGVAALVLLSLSGCKGRKEAKQGDPVSETPGGGDAKAEGNYRKWAKSGSIAQKDSAAMHFYRKKQYDRAVYLLEELNGIYAGTPRGEEIYYYYAWTRYRLGELKSASFYFDDFAKRFPGNRHAVEFAYMNARCLYQLSDPFELDQTYTLKALEELQLFASRFPNSEYSGKASEMVHALREKLAKKAFEQANLYYKIGYYKSAVVSFKLMMDEFPDSDLRQEAHFLLIKSTLQLAAESIPEKREERFSDAEVWIEKFAQKYPDSKFAKDAENLKDVATKGKAKAAQEIQLQKEGNLFVKFKSGLEAALDATDAEEKKSEYTRAMGWYEDLQRLNPQSTYLKEAEKVFRKYERRNSSTQEK